MLEPGKHLVEGTAKENNYELYNSITWRSPTGRRA